MDRRTYLGTVGIAGLTSVAGCLDRVVGGGDSGNGNADSGSPNTVLEPPEHGHDLSEASHPSYGEEFPAVSVPDPLSGETISTDQFEGDRVMLLTFFYTTCPDGVCPLLVDRLRYVQNAAAENGYSDEAALLAMTFDPERDSPEAIRTFGTQRGVDLEAGNFHFLRPDSYETAKRIVADTYGLPLQKQYDHDFEGLDYTFPHLPYIFLVNKRGYLERVYLQGSRMDMTRLANDFETVVNG